MKLNLSFTSLLPPKFVVLLGRVVVPILTAGVAIGLIAALFPAPTAASFQSGASPASRHQVGG